jgi:DNA invertase Pin-like site-specific DNA recombinase
MKIGYARVSTKDQSTDSQLASLEKAECKVIFEENESGAKRDRPELDKALNLLKAGDVLVVYKLDRLSRSTQDLLEISEKIKKSGAHLQCTEQSINTSDAMGDFFFTILGAIAQLERQTIIDRTIAGLEAAKAQGRVGGRPKKFDGSTKEAAKALLDAGKSREEVCKQFNLKRATFYRMMAS